MKTLKIANIENRLYFLNSMTNIKNFDSSLLNIDQVLFKKHTDCVIYYIKCFKIFDRKNFLYLVFNKVDAYIEKYNGNKYLSFACTHKKKEAFRKLQRTLG